MSSEARAICLQTAFGMKQAGDLGTDANFDKAYATAETMYRWCCKTGSGDPVSSTQSRNTSFGGGGFKSPGQASHGRSGSPGGSMTDEEKRERLDTWNKLKDLCGGDITATQNKMEEMTSFKGHKGEWVRGVTNVYRLSPKAFHIFKKEVGRSYDKIKSEQGESPNYQESFQPPEPPPDAYDKDDQEGLPF